MIVPVDGKNERQKQGVTYSIWRYYPYWDESMPADSDFEREWRENHIKWSVSVHAEKDGIQLSASMEKVTADEQSAWMVAEEQADKIIAFLKFHAIGATLRAEFPPQGNGEGK